ncbi:MAG: phage holin family protein [Gammaproteobacteria bacterium]|nr:phage holin family protein [Gammaproteobacteria bacterium]MBI5619181.1 phage holin family protein [Gammaproteobacteria bacterium]
MSVPAPDTEAAPPSREIPAGGLFELLPALLDTWRELAETRFSIFAHEIRGAGLAVAAMVGMAVAAGLLAASTWILLVALGMRLAMNRGLSWEGAALIMFAVNLAAAVGLAFLVRRTSTQLLFKATRES